jgi:hypothetical protein
MKIIFGALLLVFVHVSFRFEWHKWRARTAFPRQAYRANLFLLFQLGAWALACLCVIVLVR